MLIEKEEREKKDILRHYRILLRSAQYSKTKESRALIRRAFDLALEAHKNMRRKSGEPYIIHPLEVAIICAKEIGLGTTSIVCALLHDVVEDSYINLKDIEKQFNKKIAKIIDGLTKISEVIDNTPSIQAENFRKILLTLSDDVRVILIKLADRLHNMRTIDAMPRQKQLKMASETSFLYAPLAHRLGLYAIKSELEDLALKITEPDIYKSIEQKLKKTKAVRTRFINKFSFPIKKALEKEGFNFEIKGRTKSISSIFNKMQKKGIPFEEVYDVFAIRIIIDTPFEKEKADCWKVYSIVTDFYKPNPDRLRDWISTPKANGYESLHTTVMSPTGKWVEVQIRSKRMDEIAEKGFAAHWKYKENRNDETALDEWIKKIRNILENSNESALEFIDEFKLNLFSDEIFVFTPKGEIKNLPAGASALDFAYEIHTQVGNHCLGAKVNNKLVPLSYKLKSGDQVEIITSRKQKPKDDWLKFVITSKARSKIKAALKAEKKAIIAEGKEILQRKFKHIKVVFNSSNINQLLIFYDIPTATELYYQIAIGKIDLKKIGKLNIENGKLKLPQKNIDELEIKSKDFSKKGIYKNPDEALVIGDDMQKLDYELSKCCNPIPGDEIFAFVTVGGGIKIHKINCPNAEKLLSKYAYRVIKARWLNQKQIAFLAGIKVLGIDEVGIVNKITKIISGEFNINMRSISFDSNDGIFEGTIMVFVYDTSHLNDLIKNLKEVDGVTDVYRIDPYQVKRQIQ